MNAINVIIKTESSVSKEEHVTHVTVKSELTLSASNRVVKEKS